MNASAFDPSTFDWDAHFKKQVEEAMTKAKKSRAELLAQLRGLSVTQLTITYSGSGDSGQIDDWTWESLIPHKELDEDDELNEKVCDFGWELVSACGHSGFENNEGGDGEIVWDTIKDEIQYKHRDAVISYEETEHEL
jgi:hypothetical protein